MPLSSCFSPLITAAGRGCCDHRAVTKLHRDEECEKDEQSTLPQETVGLCRNRDSITKDGHAPFFMLLFLDHGDHGTQSGVNTAATFTLPRGMVWLRRDQNSMKKDGHAPFFILDHGDRGTESGVKIAVTLRAPFRDGQVS